MPDLSYWLRQNRQLVKTLSAKLGDWVKGSREWIEFECPYCDDQGHHLGINLRTKTTRCLRCDARPPVGTLLKLKSSYRPLAAHVAHTEHLDREIQSHGDTFYRDTWEEQFKPLINVGDNLNTYENLSIIGQNALKYLHSRKIDLNLLNAMATGLVGLVSTDRLRGRIVFISTTDGKPTYYQARAIPDICGSKFKTLNPRPDEGWSDQSRIIFFYDNIKPHTKIVVIVEGVEDAISSTSMDFTTVGIPLLGKTISAMQLMKLKRLRDRDFVVALDKDARLESIERALEFYDSGFNIRLLIWPSNFKPKDPAEAHEKTGKWIDYYMPLLSSTLGDEITVASLRAELIKLKEIRRYKARRQANRRHN